MDDHEQRKKQTIRQKSPTPCLLCHNKVFKGMCGNTQVLVKVSSGFTGRPCQDNPKFNREGLHSLLPQFFQGSLEKGAKESIVSSSIERALLGKSTCVCSVHQGVPRTMRAKFIADILHKFTEVLIKGFLKRSFIYLRNTERAPICC